MFLNQNNTAASLDEVILLGTLSQKRLWCPSPLCNKEKTQNIKSQNIDSMRKYYKDYLTYSSISMVPFLFQKGYKVTNYLT